MIGPSNPIISIGPILAIDAIRSAIADSPAPVVAVSPIVGGEVLKGPTAACLAWAGLSADADGVARHYEPLLDAILADEPVDGVRSLERDTRMHDAASRRRVAADTLELAGLPVSADAHAGDPPRQALRAGQDAPGRAARHRRSAAGSRRRWSPTCSTR